MQKEIRGFQGVNLRQDRLSIADEELAKSINADLHSEPNTIILRYGRSAQYSSALSDTLIRRIAKVNGIMYRVAGNTLYRETSSILTTLSSNLITTIIPFRPLNEQTIWAFIADDNVMQKDNGSSITNWGISSPSTKATLSVGSSTGLTGDYKVQFTYVRKKDGVLLHESNPSPISDALTVSDENIDISDIPTSSDSQVTHKRIYRSLANGSVTFFDTEIEDSVTSVSLDQADTALGSQVATNNDVPPNASWAVSHQEHIFLCRDASNPHYLWWSRRFRPESFPSDQFLEIGNADDPLQCAIENNGLLAVFSKKTKYRILGNVTTGFIHQEALSRRGTSSPLAVIPTPFGIIFVANDGVFVTNIASKDTEISSQIAPLFNQETKNEMSPINLNKSNTISSAYFKNKFYFSYPSGTSTNPDTIAVFSNDTKKWYFFDHPIRSLYVDHDFDELVGGSTDGFTYVLETGTDDGGSDISLEVQTKDYSGGVHDVRKLFRYFKIDADMLTGTLTAEVFIDNVALPNTFSITGTRTKQLIPLPQDAFGYSWRVKLTYSGTSRIKIYGVSMQWLPLGVS